MKCDSKENKKYSKIKQPLKVFLIFFIQNKEKIKTKKGLKMHPEYHDNHQLIINAKDKLDLKTLVSSASRECLLAATKSFILAGNLDKANYCLHYLSIHPLNRDIYNASYLRSGISYFFTLFNLTNKKRPQDKAEQKQRLSDFHIALIKTLHKLLTAYTNSLQTVIDKLRKKSGNPNNSKTFVELCNEYITETGNVIETLSNNEFFFEQLSRIYGEPAPFEIYHELEERKDTLLSIAQNQGFYELLSEAQNFYQQDNGDAAFLYTYGKYLEKIEAISVKQLETSEHTTSTPDFIQIKVQLDAMARNVLNAPTSNTIHKLINKGKYAKALRLCNDSLDKIRKYRNHFALLSPPMKQLVNHLNNSIIYTKELVAEIEANNDAKLATAETLYKNQDFSGSEEALDSLATHHQTKRSSDLREFIAIHKILAELETSTLSPDNISKLIPEGALDALKTVAKILQINNVDLREMPYQTSRKRAEAAKTLLCNPMLTERCESAVHQLIPKAREALEAKVSVALGKAHAAFSSNNFQHCELYCSQALANFIEMELAQLKPFIASKLFPEITQPFHNLTQKAHEAGLALTIVQTTESQTTQPYPLQPKCNSMAKIGFWSPNSGQKRQRPPKYFSENIYDENSTGDDNNAAKKTRIEAQKEQVTSGHKILGDILTTPSAPNKVVGASTIIKRHAVTA